MKKVLILTTDDFINPEQIQQPFYKWEFKNGRKMSEFEAEIDVLILNGQYILNRFGATNKPATLEELIKTTYSQQVEQFAKESEVEKWTC